MAAAGLFFAIVMSDAQLRMLVEGDTSLLDEAALDWRAGAISIALQNRLKTARLSIDAASYIRRAF